MKRFKFLLNRRFLKWFLLIWVLFFSPVSLLYLCKNIMLTPDALPGFLMKILTWLVTLPLFAMILMRCFYLQYIILAVFAVLCILSIFRELRSDNFRLRNWAFILLLLCLAFVQCLPLETVFRNAMSV